MSKLAFSLIELILVIILIGLISFLTFKLPSISFSKHTSMLNLRDMLYPKGTFYLFDDGSELVVNSKENINLTFNNPKVYVFNGKFFEKKEFGYFKNKKIIFKYSVKNGIGDSFIVKNGDDYYVFKPFVIKNFSSFKEAKDFFFLKKYQPKIGEFY